jgi:hypothetical protein
VARRNACANPFTEDTVNDTETGLTPEQEAQLRRPFSAHEHGFVNGRPYIRKDAIRRRLSQVDPAWQTLAPTVLSMADDTVVLTGALIVCGVVRYDIGTGIIMRYGRDGKSELPSYEISRNNVRAFKTAASDLIPRCAVQFGVGEYLKNVPRNVSDERSLADWLRSINAQGQQMQAQQGQAQGRPQQQQPMQQRPPEPPPAREPEPVPQQQQPSQQQMTPNGRVRVPPLRRG